MKRKPQSIRQRRMEMERYAMLSVDRKKYLEGFWVVRLVSFCLVVTGCCDYILLPPFFFLKSQRVEVPLTLTMLR